MASKVLITGAHGQLGQALLRLAPPHWAVTPLGSAQLDIADAGAVGRQVKALRPSLILNAAAYNAVDLAEQERCKAFAVNAQGPLNLARAANDVGARLVHVSTDYVFDGRAGRPYKEQDAANPLNVYGESKLQGEQWVSSEQPHALVVRTAWVYSAIQNNFVAAMLRAARQGKPVRVVDDQTGAPTFADDLAQAIIDLVMYSGAAPNAADNEQPMEGIGGGRKMMNAGEQGGSESRAALGSGDDKPAGPSVDPKVSGSGFDRSANPGAAGGIYHFTGATALTRYDFARAIFEAAEGVRDAKGADPARFLSWLSAVASSQYPSAATRPKYSVLDCSKITALGITPRPLTKTLPDVVRRLLI